MFLLLMAFLVLLSFLLRLLLQLLALGYHWNGNYHPYGFPGPGGAGGGASGGAAVEAGPRAQQNSTELLRETQASQTLAESRQRRAAGQLAEQVSHRALEWVLERAGSGNQTPVGNPGVENTLSPEQPETHRISLSRSPSPVACRGIPRVNPD
jgi:hypothetical protein